MEGFTSGKGPADGAPAAVDTGTTTVGIVAGGRERDAVASSDGDRAGDAVVLATDRRASLGGRFVSNKSAEKIMQVHPTAAITIAGGVGDGQAFAKQLRAQSNLYESRRGEPMSMDALSTTAAAVVRGKRVVPLLGGVDAEGGHLFSLDPAGGLMTDVYGATGSGMQLAYGLLEQEFEEGMTVDEAKSAAVRAVATASERDTASGNGVTVARITDEGVNVETRDSAVVETDAAAGEGR